MREILRQYGNLLVAAFGLVGFYILVQDTPEAWLLPAVLLGTAVALVAIRLGGAVIDGARRTLGRLRTYDAISKENAKLASERDQARADARINQSGMSEAFRAGIDEGTQRATGRILADGTPPPTLCNVVVRDGNVSLFADFVVPAPPVGSRFTLKLGVTSEVLAVVESREVTTSGKLELKLVDRRHAAFWEAIYARPATETRVPDGVIVVEYDPDAHHSPAPQWEASPDAPA